MSRQGVAANEQPRSNKYRQEAANEHQIRNTYEKPNLWSQTNTNETFGKKNCLDEGDKWTEGVYSKCFYLDVSYVAVAIHICCKRTFQMFHLF
jgi:hypothetical protein